MFPRETFTTAAIHAYLRISPDLARLDGYPDHKVVIHKPQQPQQRQRLRDKQRRVALISGGGDGHSPDTMGFIGHGMLTAVISGNLFASPSTESICAAVKHLTETDHVDILMIIKNYTGDRLNFGLALELTQETTSLDEHQHHQHHYGGHHQFHPMIHLVIVGDDVAIPRGHSIAGRRGIAGTILVIKIAGAAAEEGKSITEVSNIARSTAARLVSLSAVFRSCHLPGEELEVSDRIGKNEIALGWGIHNEQGFTRIPMERIDCLVNRMMDMLLSNDRDRDFFWADQKEERNDHRPIHLVSLVNNLGSMIDNEMNIIMGHILDELQQRGFIIDRAFCSKLMTGLDQRGFSLTLMRLPEDREQSESILRYLDADTTAPGWPNNTMKATPRDRPTSIQMPHTETAASIVSIRSNPLVHTIILNIARSLVESVDELNALDSQAGDGDCGNTFKQGASALLADLEPMSSSESGSSSSSSPVRLSLLFDSLRRYTAAMGGTTGALYSILLTGAAKHAAELEQQTDGGDRPSNPKTTTKIVAESLKAGVEVLQRYSGAQLNDRTMLDALCPALDAFLDNLSSNANDAAAIRIALQAAVDAANSGLSSTQHMTARAGRASYVPFDISKQGVDPGARAIVIVLDSIVHTIQNTVADDPNRSYRTY